MSPALRSVASPLFAGLLVALLVTGCGSNGNGAAATDTRTTEATPVEVAAASRRPIAASYTGTANLEATAEAQVVSKATGVLLAVHVEEGDAVRAGQLLARLDPDRKGLALAQVEAQVRKLESEYARSQELFSRQLVSADQHERLRSELEVQRAAVDIAKLEVAYTRILAPIDGVIAERMVKTGNLIQINQSLFRIVDDRKLEAVLNLPERELATMRAGLPVRMQVDALAGHAFDGIVDRVSPVVDAGSGTFRVTAAFESGGRLRPGMFGRIEVVYDERENVLTVPREALEESDGIASVFSVRQGLAVRVPVSLGFINGRFAEIREGLAEGEQVVTVGKVSLRDGSAVEVLNPPVTSVPAAVAENEIIDQPDSADENGIDANGEGALAE